MANTANAVPTNVALSVLGIERMALLTPILARVNCGRTNAAQDIFFVRDRAKVPWINAAPIAANVVNDQRMVHVWVHNVEGKAVRGHTPSRHRELAVAAGGYDTLPLPALTPCASLDARPEFGLELWIGSVSAEKSHGEPHMFDCGQGWR